MAKSFSPGRMAKGGSPNNATGKFAAGKVVAKSSSPAPSTSPHANRSYGKGGKSSGAAANINNKKQ